MPLVEMDTSIILIIMLLVVKINKLPSKGEVLQNKGCRCRSRRRYTDISNQTKPTKERTLHEMVPL